MKVLLTDLNFTRVFKKCLIPSACSALVSVSTTVMKSDINVINIAAIGWLICGMVAFREVVCGRSSCEFFFSLPTKRTDVFKARFLAAFLASVVCIGIAIAMLMLWTICNNCLGSNMYVWYIGSLVKQFFEALVTAFSCIAAGVLGTVCSSSVIQSYILPTGVWLTPAVVFTGTDLLAGRLLLGNSYTFVNGILARIITIEEAYCVSDSMRCFDISRSPMLNEYFPRVVKLSELSEYIIFSDIVSVTIRLIVGVALALLCRWCFVKKSGIQDDKRISNVVSLICIGSFAYFLFGAAMYGLVGEGGYDVRIEVMCGLVLGLAALCAGLTVLVSRFALKCKGKKTLAIGGAAAFAVMLTVSAVIVTGGFGYEKRLPKADKVLSAYTNYIFDENNDQLTVEEVVAAHKEYLENEGWKDDRDVAFSYYLKNGSKMVRVFHWW